MTSFEWFRPLAPEGQFVCCICFEAKPIEQAWTDDTGQPWDICESCEEIEREAHERRLLMDKQFETDAWQGA